MMETTSKTRGAAIDLRPGDDREMELLIHLARASIEPERAERIRRLVADGLNWSRLLTLAQRNGLSPLLYFHLNQICGPGLADRNRAGVADQNSTAGVPAEQFAFLRDYFQKNSAFSLLLTGELARLLRALKENSIDAVPYKGPALALKLYGNLALRQFCDLDILVRESDVWQASEVIAARGFEPHFRIPADKRAAFVRLSYVQLFRRDAGRTLIELHWAIAPRFFGVRFDAEALWQRLEPLSLPGATVSIPGAADLLLMLCVHGAKDCWEKLEWVGAIAELLRREPALDWERVFQQSRQMRCQRMLALGLLLAHGLFDAPLPPQAAALSRSRKLPALAKQVTQAFSAATAHPPTFTQRLSFHLRLKDSFADRARHCARLALTTTPVDWSTAPLPRPLAFAYPLLRAVRLTRKYGLSNEQPRSANLPNRNEAA